MTDDLSPLYDEDFTPYAGFSDFISTPVFTTLLHVRNKIVLLVTGNRFGKTKYFTRLISYRIMGMSRYPEHNILLEDKCRIIRLAAQLLPEDKKNEVRNTIYPMLKAQLPSNLIVKDITMRSPVLTVSPLHGGPPIQLEFVSYGQVAQTQAGVDRRLIYADEVAPYAFYEESMPRLATTNGQFMVGMTPVEAGWMHTELYERAKVYIRTPKVRAFMEHHLNQKVPQVERTDSKSDICVIQAASDDNPVFSVMVRQKKRDIKAGKLSKEDFPYETVSEYLDSVFMYDDDDTVAMRRYGLFRQITGAVFKQFQWQTHVVSAQRYFPTGEIPRIWKHARLIDYHQSVPWAIIWIALSPDDEAFVYEEMNPDPHNWTTLGICKEMAKVSRDYKFTFNLIDKLAAHKQVNTNTSCMEDMNRIFSEMRREGLGTGGYWEEWDDRGTKGQDKIRERLINSRICGKPFNNLQKIDGKEQRLPTLWILDNCKQTALSLKNWKMEEWLSRESIITKDPKDKPEMKWSHFCKSLECCVKDSRFRARPYEYGSHREEFFKQRYFKGQR